MLTAASRRYVLYRMAHVTGTQRWGVPAGAGARATVHLKNGWLPYPDKAGIDTIQRAAKFINWNLAAF